MGIIRSAFVVDEKGKLAGVVLQGQPEGHRPEGDQGAGGARIERSHGQARRSGHSGAQITDVVTTNGNTFVGIFGVGPVVAGRIPRRIAAPPSLTRREPTHQPCAAPGRSAQMVTPPPPAAYYDRKLAEGTTTREALRCLKRRLAEVCGRPVNTRPVSSPCGSGFHAELHGDCGCAPWHGSHERGKRTRRVNIAGRYATLRTRTVTQRSVAGPGTRRPPTVKAVTKVGASEW